MDEAIEKVLSNRNMRPYLEEKTLPDVRNAIKELLQQIVNNKDLERHWQTKERENLRLIRNTRRAERDRKRLEQGSAYQSDEEDKALDLTDSSSESDSYYDSQDEGEDGSSEERLLTQSDLGVTGTNANNGFGVDVSSPLSEIQSRSALEVASPTIRKKSNNGLTMGEISINLAGSAGFKTNKLSNSKSRSHKSKHSLQQFHFNPLRFLGMFLIEKNQERREHEKKKIKLEGVDTTSSVSQS